MNVPLIVGVDFDNTIVLYDGLFYQCALEEGLIRATTVKEKRTIRDEIRCLPSGEKRWTMLQSLVYGERMHEAKLAEGFSEFMYWIKERGYRVCIISHKTQYPAMGVKTDLRITALNWMQTQGLFNTKIFGLNAETDVFFESTREDKLQRISIQKCTHFIDDLEEVLRESDFPKHVQRIHYTKKITGMSTIGTDTDVLVCSAWTDILGFFRNLK